MFTKNGTTRTTTGNFGITTMTHLSFRETAGAAARFTIRAGGSGGYIVEEITLGASESDRIDYMNPVVGADSLATNPIHLTVDSGAVSVSATGA